MSKGNYYAYSDFLKERFGEKVYKIPVSLACTCPNRDGNISYNGCIFCGDCEISHEARYCEESIKDQFQKTSDYIRSKYNAKKFILFFQNYTNTYIELDKLTFAIDEVINRDDIVGLNLSTRPDCLNDDFAEYFASINKQKQVTIELGLQSINHKTLSIINRGHSLSEFLDASLRLHRHGLRVCAHMILDMPWDDITDVIEGSKILSAIGIEEVKLHSLFVPKDTILAKMYLDGEVKLLSKEDYIDRTIAFIRHLSPSIVIQRLVGRISKEGSIIANDNTSWWLIRDSIVNEMDRRGYSQGDLNDYLNGSANRRIRR